MPIRRALLSVSDKEGLTQLGRALALANIGDSNIGEQRRDQQTAKPPVNEPGQNRQQGRGRRET